MTLEAILDAARASGAAQAEVFRIESEETPVRFEANRLKEINRRHSAGVALRVIKDGRIGFASSTRPGDVEDVVAAAIETAPFGPEAHLDFPARSEPASVNVFDEATEILRVEAMVETGQKLIDDARDAEPELLCDSMLRRNVQTVTIANSNGGYFTYRSTMLSVWMHGTLVRDTDMLFVGDADASCRPDLDTDRISETVRGQLKHSRRNAEIRTAELPVIFSSLGVAGALLSPLTLAFSGRLIHQQQSPLVGRLGQEMYDHRFSMWDDATMQMRPAARPFDDEGVPSRRIPLVEKGVVRRFLYDLQTAGLAKAESTGHAERSLTSQPQISTSCLMIEPGDKTLDEMVSEVNEGLVVDELMGAGQGNVLGGDFSGNVLLGYKIEGGEIVGRVKDTIVAGNVHEALARLVHVGSEARWVGGTVSTPPLLFDHLAVSGKG